MLCQAPLIDLSLYFLCIPAYPVRMTPMSPTETQAQTSPWVPSDKTFGARLALIRQRMGWGNVKKAAEECGLPVQSWRTWERDGVMPHRFITIAITIATRTGCDLDWLVYGPEKPIKPIATGMRLDPHVVATVVAREAASDPLRPVRQTRPSMPPKLVGRSAA